MIGAYQTEDNKKNHFAIIIAAYVSQNARGKGIAKLLMEHLLAQLIATTSIKTFTLSVNPTQVAAIKLYESFGFILIKKEPTTFGDGIRRETYFMQKTIS